MIKLETERLALRLLNDDDAPMIMSLLNEPSFIQNIGDKKVRDIEGALNYIHSGPLAMQNQFGFSLYCCQLKTTGETIGISGLIKRPEIEFPEVGFAFFQQYCGQGFGFESASVVMKYAHEKLNFQKLHAICNSDNVASIALLKKLAFRYLNDIVLPNNDNTIKLFEHNAE